MIEYIAFGILVVFFFLLLILTIKIYRADKKAGYNKEFRLDDDEIERPKRKRR